MQINHLKYSNINNTKQATQQKRNGKQSYQRDAEIEDAGMKTDYLCYATNLRATQKQDLLQRRKRTKS